LRQWIDDRSGVRIQEKVRLSLYPQVERSGYVSTYRRGEQDQEARR
jgi:hypothetical protein